MRRVIEVPELVRQRAEANGETGRRWLDELPDLADSLAGEWGLALGRTLHGGSAAYLAEATTQAGETAVLKLSPPSEELAGEIATLTAAGGRGYVRLLRCDPERRALLQERLGASLSSLDLPVDDQIAALCAALSQAWAAEPPQGLTSGAEKARWLAEFIARLWEELDRPCSERAVAQALNYAERRAAAFDPERCVLVHGDAHSDNALAAPGGGFRFVDPDGLLAEPACDLAVPMREWSEDLLAGDPRERARLRCARLAALTGMEPEPIWEWGAMERLSTGLLCTQLGYQPTGRDMLKVADACAGEG